MSRGAGGEKIRALVFEDNKLELVDKARPDPNEDEVLIKVKMAGICNTDLEITAGYLDFNGTLGHEFVGVVKKDPAGNGELVGERVVGSINIPCGECYLCERGIDNHCVNMKSIGMRGKDGAFAEYLTLARSNIHKVPPEISDKEAVLVEPLAAAMEIIEEQHIKPSDEVVILGDGKLGLSVARVLWGAAKDPKLIGKHKNKLAKVEDLGIDSYLLGEYSGHADVVVECTGSSSGLQTALKHIRPRGTIVLKTTTADLNDINMSRVAVDEINIVGSRCGPFAPTLKMMENNDLALEEMIDEIYDFENALDAFERAKESDSLKVLLRID